MSNNDDMTMLALAYLHNKENTPEHIRDAFANMPPAPLAVVIEQFLNAQPKIDLVPLLRRIADLNQGRIEDLNAPVFVSYLIAECDTDDVGIRRVISALRAFKSLNETPNDAKKMLIAARDEENSGRKLTTASEILRQIRKRVK